MREARSGEPSDHELLERIWLIAMCALQGDITDNRAVSEIIGVIEVNRKPGLTTAEKNLNACERRAQFEIVGGTEANDGAEE